MKNINEYIDQEFPRFIKELQEFCKIPSISQENRSIKETVDWLNAFMEQVGINTRILSFPGSFPFIFGEIKGQSDKVLLYYNHYDVQPVEPLDEWQSQPFSAEIRNGMLFARGAADDKGCLLSRLHAVEAWKAYADQLPITIKFLFEGEEEIGSPHFISFVNQHKDILKADACIWEYSSKDASGNPTIRLGNKGICFLELIAYGAEEDVHSMYEPLLSNPIWNLVWALSSLKGQDERILIDGFYEHVDKLSDIEYKQIQDLYFDIPEWEAQIGAIVKDSDMSSHEMLRRLFFEPTCNISGIVSGYTKEGVKTIIPSTATAKLDIRLVPSQDPQEIFLKVKQHLSRHGFNQIEVNMLGQYLPSKTPISSPFVHLVVETGHRVYGRKVTIEPMSPGSGPRSAFSSWTDMPIAAIGVAHIGSKIHGPNENIRLEDYREGVKHNVEIISALGDRNILTAD